MKHFFSSHKNLRYTIYGLLAVVLVQAVVMITFINKKDDKVYQVNLVQIKKTAWIIRKLKTTLHNWTELLKVFPTF